MSNLNAAFHSGKAFIPFLTCGDPDLATTRTLIRTLVENGAGAIELGLPFSDPTAEGVAIQDANLRALSGGLTTDAALAFVRELRREITVPLVIVSYANVVFSYGAEKFLAACREMQVDGLLLPDVSYEEKEDFQPICREYGVDWITLIAPTSGERLTRIAAEAEGFVCLLDGPETEKMAAQVRQIAPVPCVIGFGDVTPERAAELSRCADGLCAIEAVVLRAGQFGAAAAPQVAEYARAMRQAMA